MRPFSSYGISSFSSTLCRICKNSQTLRRKVQIPSSGQKPLLSRTWRNRTSPTHQQIRTEQHGVTLKKKFASLQKHCHRHPEFRTPVPPKWNPRALLTQLILQTSTRNVKYFFADPQSNKISKIFRRPPNRLCVFRI